MIDLNRSLNECPKCKGPADNGHDRCHPPTAYWCTKCMKLPEPPICCVECGQPITGITVSGTAKFAKGCPRCGKYMGDSHIRKDDADSVLSVNKSPARCEISVVNERCIKKAIMEGLNEYAEKIVFGTMYPMTDSIYKAVKPYLRTTKPEIPYVD